MSTGTHPATGESRTGLVRTLGVLDLIWLIIGTVIGSGIFIVPQAVLIDVKGSAGMATLVWLTGGVLSLLGALTYGELSASSAEAGGLYVYLRDGFGRFPAFLYGWALFFVIGSGSAATLAVAFSNYFGQFVSLSPLIAKVIAVAMIAVVAVVNVIGTRESADLQNWATGIKVGAILLMSAVLLVAGRGHHPAANSAAMPASPSPSLLAGFGIALIAVLWAYEGWQYATFSAGETRDVQRSFPRAFLIGSAALIAIYLLANAGYLAVLGTTGIMQTNRVAATAVTAVLGPSAGKLIALAILLSMFSATNGLMLTTPRVFYAMAADKLFFRKLAEVHPRFHTPAISVVACSVWAAILAATGTYITLLTYVVFTGWIFYALGAACVFVYRKRLPEQRRPYRVPGYPLTPILFIAAALAIVINTIISQPRNAAFGLIIIFIGAPAYFIWSRTKTAPGR